MQSTWQRKGKKVHTRQIEVTTYEYDGQRIIVEGFLKDDRFQEGHWLTGETKLPGVIHHMAIRLLVNCTDFSIEDVDVDLLSVPREGCLETIKSLAPIKGLIITSGFTSKVKKLVGGKKGCAHLVALILAMAPAAIQGFAAYQAQKPAGFDPSHAAQASPLLINSCRVWREGGPLAERYKKMLDMNKTV